MQKSIDVTLQRISAEETQEPRLYAFRLHPSVVKAAEQHFADQLDGDTLQTKINKFARYLVSTTLIQHYPEIFTKYTQHERLTTEVDGEGADIQLAHEERSAVCSQIESGDKGKETEHTEGDK